MSLAFPNQTPAGQNPDSFSGSAAFSFEQHNPTPLFSGINTEPQTQMQSHLHNQIQMQNATAQSSHSVPMLMVSQTEFSNDCDMDNAPRDEDFDVDLDIDQYDEDGDLNLDDHATPMATAEDDLMGDAINIPSVHPLFGQPGPSNQFSHPDNNVVMGQATDEEMVDDALGQTVNEDMFDAYQAEPVSQFGFQPLQQVQPSPSLPSPVVAQAAPQLQAESVASLNPPAEVAVTAPSNENQSVSPVVSDPFREYQKPEEEPKVASEEELVAPGVAAEAEPDISQVEHVAEQPEKEATAPVKVVEPGAPLPTEVLALPQSASPSLERANTPPHNLEVPKLQTPPSSDALRISQADTVPLENPTPEVGQREWYLSGLAQHGDQTTPGSPQALAHIANQEIPTSPIQEPSGGESSGPSFHSEAQSPHLSQHSARESPQTIENTEEKAPEESARESVEEEENGNASTEDPLLSHPVVIVYRDLEFSLFPVLGDKSGLPETSFLPDRTHLGSPLSKLVASLRDVLGEEFNASEEIILNFTALGVEFEEENVQMNNFTLYDLLDLFSRLSTRDGVDETRPLSIRLTSRKKYIPKLEMIHHHILRGGGLASWKKVLGGKGKDSTHNLGSQNIDESVSHHDDRIQQQPEQEEQNPQDNNHSEAEILQEQGSEQHLENDDEELELEEFEKELGTEDAYDQLETHENEPQYENAVSANVDVPKSPSQTSIEKSKPTLATETSNTDGSLHVPETQYSQNYSENMEENDEFLPSADLEISNSLNRDDDASFVTAEEKQQDRSTTESHIASRSYGLPASPNSNEEAELYNENIGKGMEQHAHSDGEEIAENDGLENLETYDYHLLTSVDDGVLDFEEQEPENKDEQTDAPQDDAKSSSTLHEVSGGEKADELAFEGEDGAGTDNQVNWDQNAWEYVEDEENDGQYKHEEGTKQEVASYSEASHEILSSHAAFEDNDDEELDLDAEFAYYPLPFSPNNKKTELDEHADDASLLGLDQDNVSTTHSTTKRAREDDDEDEDEYSSGGEGASPIPASKKHKAL
ncbi:hypothetical protein TWF694_008836 [Orbilia ellipsospora]|uniref:Uncharacterized protein n=1 Tax=Orbilia ellipsospora TaxID=2528407 RepID=A0AAV9XJJ8_9PEZI